MASAATASEWKTGQRMPSSITVASISRRRDRARMRELHTCEFAFFRRRIGGACMLVLCEQCWRKPTHFFRHKRAAVHPAERQNRSRRVHANLSVRIRVVIRRRIGGACEFEFSHRYMAGAVKSICSMRWVLSVNIYFRDSISSKFKFSNTIQKKEEPQYQILALSRSQFLHNYQIATMTYQQSTLELNYFTRCYIISLQQGSGFLRNTLLSLWPRFHIVFLKRLCTAYCILKYVVAKANHFCSHRDG